MLEIKNYVSYLTMLVLAALCACSGTSDYERMVQKELASGERNDTLFLGLYFGMTANEFYDHCWKLNREGLVREGAMNTTVYYEVEELPYKGALDFYPVFKDGRVQAMTGFTHYIGWAPWNKHLWAPQLLEDTRVLFESWYGKGFVEVKSPGTGKAYVKVDGNRQILLFYDRDERVEFLFTDLTNDDEMIQVQPL